MPGVLLGPKGDTLHTPTAPGAGGCQAEMSGTLTCAVWLTPVPGAEVWLLALEYSLTPF